MVGYPPFIGIYVGKGTDNNPQDQASQQQHQTNNGFGGFGNGFSGNGNGNGNGGSPNFLHRDVNLFARPRSPR